MNAAECLLSAGADAAVALECGDARIRFGELRDAVRRAAEVWRHRGVVAGTRVVIFAPDGIDWVIAYLGVIWAGGVAVGVNPRLGMADLGSILVNGEVGCIWCEPDVAPAIRDAAQRLPTATLVTVADNDWAAALDAAAGIDACARGDEDPALWIGTSGTTGKPKAVIHAHRAAVDPHSFAERVLHATSADKFYATSKLFFAYALANSLFAGLRLGATVVLDREWPTPERVRAIVAHHRPTVLFTVPTLYNSMLRRGIAPALADSGIRHFVSAGEALPGAVRDAWLAGAGKAPISGYGTSETLCLVLYGDDTSDLLRATPLTELRVGDAHAADVPQRVWIRNPTLAPGYWRQPEAQADGFRDGWFSPGDMFLRRDGDRLEFAGRSDDLVKVAGQWVSTLWIERALTEAGGDAIEQVAAVGVPTRDGLTAIAVLAVAVAGREDSARQRCDAGIAGLPKHRRPSWVHWVNALPLTATGKLQRSGLRDAHASALAANRQG